MQDSQTVDSHELNCVQDQRASPGWIFGTYTFFLFVGGAQFGKKRLCSYSLVGDMFIIVSGTILDSHGPLYVILPGSIGMVLSLIFLSFSQGKFIMVSPRWILISAHDRRILSNILILQCTGRNISQHALHTTNCGRWSLVQHSTWLGNWHCMHGWGVRRRDIPPRYYVCGPSNWLFLVYSHYCFDMCSSVLCWMSHSSD
jgi:hypothetical protein